MLQTRIIAISSLLWNLYLYWTWLYILEKNTIEYRVINLRDRATSITLGRRTSPMEPARTGIPQGSPVSPIQKAFKDATGTGIHLYARRSRYHLDRPMTASFHGSKGPFLFIPAAIPSSISSFYFHSPTGTKNLIRIVYIVEISPSIHNAFVDRRSSIFSQVCSIL